METFFDKFTRAMEEGLHDPELPQHGTAGSAETIRHLMAAFTNESWVVRRKASQALARFGTEALDSLEKGIAVRDPDVRYWSIRTLGSIGTPGIPALTRALGSNDQEISTFAAESLAEMDDDAVIPPLVNALGNSSWTLCNTIANALARMGKRSIPALGEALRSRNEDKTCWATVVLGRMGNDAISPLIKFLRSNDKTMRFYAARALGESGEEKAIKPLIEALGDSYWTVRRNAAEALGKIGGKAIDHLAESLKDPRPEVQKMAAQILSDIGPSALPNLLALLEDEQRNLYYEIESVIIKIGDSTVPFLIKLLNNEKSVIRGAAAQMLGKFMVLPVVKPLIGALADSSWNVRKAAAGSLQRVGMAALPHLKSALNHPSENVRFWTTRILAAMGGEAVEPLIEALKDPNAEIRIFAASALGDTDDARAVYPLIIALRDRVWTVRKGAADSLKKLGVRHIEILVKSLNDPNPDIRYWVEKIIGEIGKQAIKPLVHVLRNDRNREMRFFAAFGLSAIGDSSAVDPLIDALTTDVNDWVRKYSATALGKIGEARGIKALINAMFKERTDICEWISDVLAKTDAPPVDLLIKALQIEGNNGRLYAARALGKIRNIEAVTPLIELLETEDEALIAEIGKALITMGQSVIPDMVRALEHEKWAVRKNVADILGDFGTEAEEALNSALTKENKNLRYWATSALRKIRNDVSKGDWKGEDLVDPEAHKANRKSTSTAGFKAEKSGIRGKKTSSDSPGK
ncbi:MAG: hypothetical protein CVV64_02905 [Candidatus Wallbacteria bacterium HGW-Wallbacteria-1]|uniref:TOG domain-containing protein n=1 Tax=Candidatus Wallbacteria bacterium HGW-Wallbacteria-1 TaxID=2013854 RepID=A0A2N1PTN0_9BACT|nr:MAG: hypothetical protein CVV64_02905 [Candidatus Wallbacteria bacterium HGW-Wallbacteria-1]